MKIYPERSRRIKIIFLAIIFFSFFALIKNSQAATTYYVATTGSDTNAGTSAAPFKTIQKAANIVNPGDTVIVKDGTYTDTNSDGMIVYLNRGGISENQIIIFRAENKWGAVLDGQSNVAGYGFSFGEYINYIKIENFEIKSCNSGGVWVNGDNHDINIYGNYIHDIARVEDNNASGNAGVFIGRNTYNITADSNRFHTIGRLNYYTTPQAVPGGTVVQNEATCTTTGGVNACYGNDHGIYSYGHSQTFINNIFYDIKSGWSMQIAGGTSSDGPNWNIINNTFYGTNTQKDGHIVLYAANSVPTNVLIQNNISFNPRTGFIRSISGSSTWQFKNNLVYGAALVSSASTYTSLDNITGQDPKFVNPTNNDFHLQSTSPAIGKGLLTNAPAKDFDGVTRGSLIDIGAYEYVSGDTTAPAAPKGLIVN